MELDAIVIDKTSNRMQFVFRYYKLDGGHLKFNRPVRLSINNLVRIMKSLYPVHIVNKPNHVFIKGMCDHYGTKLKIY